MEETKITQEETEFTMQFPKYFITLNPNGFIIEIDIAKLNIIQKIILRLLGIKITKYDEKLVEKLTQKS